MRAQAERTVEMSMAPAPLNVLWGTTRSAALWAWWRPTRGGGSGGPSCMTTMPNVSVASAIHCSADSRRPSISTLASAVVITFICEVTAAAMGSRLESA